MLKEIWNDAPLWAQLTAILMCFALIILMVACTTMIKSYPQDNIIEEIAEEIIHHKTGIDVDLSPYTPE